MAVTTSISPSLSHPHDIPSDNSNVLTSICSSYWDSLKINVNLVHFMRENASGLYRIHVYIRNYLVRLASRTFFDSLLENNQYVIIWHYKIGIMHSLPFYMLFIIIRGAGSGSTDFIIHKIDIKPMPIIYPGIGYLTLIADVLKPICKLWNLCDKIISRRIRSLYSCSRFEC